MQCKYAFKNIPCIFLCLYTKELVVVCALFRIRVGQCLCAEDVLARSVKYTLSLTFAL